jgi:osmotically-inducible protein OsmY
MEKEIIRETLRNAEKTVQHSDEDIREAIRTKMNESPMLDDFDVDIAVNGGFVTLSGTVKYVNDRSLAEELASEIPGVKSIRNDLEITMGTIQIPTSATNLGERMSAINKLL